MNIYSISKVKCEFYEPERASYDLCESVAGWNEAEVQCRRFIGLGLARVRIGPG